MADAGRRGLVSMERVGMNVAADAFVNTAMTGTNGGLIVGAADYPSMHSSQNERDYRFYGKFSFVPILEPSSQQEAYDIMSFVFDLLEKIRLPVLMRITPSMVHPPPVVEPVPGAQAVNSLSFAGQRSSCNPLPLTARTT